MLIIINKKLEQKTQWFTNLYYIEKYYCLWADVQHYLGYCQVGDYSLNGSLYHRGGYWTQYALGTVSSRREAWKT